MSDTRPEAFGPAEFQAVSGVSRETLARLKLFVGLLKDWNARVNLVSAGSLADVWRRHVWDSAQLATHIRGAAGSLVDLGSGAGFPGIVLATMLQEGSGLPPSARFAGTSPASGGGKDAAIGFPHPQSGGCAVPRLVREEAEGGTRPFRVVLYEATAKKCRFLEEASHRLDLAVEIRNARMEEAKREPFDVVTARACAPLVRLLSYAEPFQGKSTTCLFLKGQSVGVELDEAYKFWSLKAERHQSLSDPSGAVLAITEVRRRER